MNKYLTFTIIAIVSLILILPNLSFVLAQEFDYSEGVQEQLTMIRISNRVYSTASRLDANLTFYPLDDIRQKSYTLTPPGAVPSASGIIFHLNQEGEIEFSIDSNVSTKLIITSLEADNLENIKNQASANRELLPYTKSSTFSDSSSPIIENKAQQLTQGAGNSVEALYTLAEYVKNSMTYDLNYSELKKASQIIVEKRGVCAQYTILFIALTRSLGIPSRYVSGIAYTTRTESFQEHAWAEVWLPDQGWVPFDVTFGQYGWLDTSHIALKKSMDAGDSSIKYSYIGGYIQPQEISIDASVIGYQIDKSFSNVTLELELYKEKVSQGSYVPLKVTIKNKNPYYVLLPIRVSIAPDVYGKFQKILLLGPNSEKETFFILYVPEKERCSNGCIAKVEVKDSFNDTSSTNLLFSDFYEEVSLDKAAFITNGTDVYFGDFDFYCIPEAYRKDDASKKILCRINSSKSKKIILCYKERCFETYSLKDREITEIIDIPKNETQACITLNESNMMLNSCVDFNKNENDSIKIVLNRFLAWLKSIFNL
jgi:transglutaminase-like putative cysteine protease